MDELEQRVVAVMHDTRISRSARNIYGALVLHTKILCDRTPTPRDELALLSHYSVRTVRRCLSELESFGLVRVTDTGARLAEFPAEFDELLSHKRQQS